MLLQCNTPKNTRRKPKIHWHLSKTFTILKYFYYLCIHNIKYKLSSILRPQKIIIFNYPTAKGPIVSIESNSSSHDNTTENWIDLWRRDKDKVAGAPPNGESPRIIQKNVNIEYCQHKDMGGFPSRGGFSVLMITFCEENLYEW